MEYFEHQNHDFQSYGEIQTGSRYYCLHVKFEGNITQFVTGDFCGDCWRSVATNRVCYALFFIIAAILILTILLMAVYQYGKAKAKTKTTSNSLYFIFAFVVIWMATRTLYYSDAFINYSFTTQGILQTLPILFTYLSITIALSNVIQLCFLIEHQQKALQKEKKKLVYGTFYFMAFFCILTQILNPIFMFHEPGTTPEQALEGEIEQNTYYYLRNSLTTAASVIFSYYNIKYTSVLLTILSDNPSMKDIVRAKVAFQCLLVEAILLMRIIMIWSANFFWYQEEQTPWLVLVIFDEIFSGIIPFGIFIFVIAQKITKNSNLSESSLIRSSVDNETNREPDEGMRPLSTFGVKVGNSSSKLTETVSDLSRLIGTELDDTKVNEESLLETQSQNKEQQRQEEQVIETSTAQRML